MKEELDLKIKRAHCALQGKMIHNNGHRCILVKLLNLEHKELCRPRQEKSRNRNLACLRIPRSIKCQKIVEQNHRE